MQDHRERRGFEIAARRRIQRVLSTNRWLVPSSSKDQPRKYTVDSNSNSARRAFQEFSLHLRRFTKRTSADASILSLSNTSVYAMPVDSATLHPTALGGVDSNVKCNGGTKEQQQRGKKLLDWGFEP